MVFDWWQNPCHALLPSLAGEDDDEVLRETNKKKATLLLPIQVQEFREFYCKPGCRPRMHLLKKAMQNTRLRRIYKYVS